MVKRIGVTLVWIFMAAGICSAQTTQYFAHVVGGLQGNIGWATAFVVSNPAAVGTAPASVTITLYEDNGTAMNVASYLRNQVTGQPGGTGNTVSFQISGGQSRFFLMEEPLFPLLTGYAKLTSNQPVVASSIFLEASAPAFDTIALAGVPGAAPLARQAAFVVKDGSTNVGIGYANPNTAAANVTFQLLNTSGTAFGTAVTKTLAGNTHGALFVSELFPSLPGTFFGTLQVTTDAATPVVATTLLFTEGGLFSTIPMIPLP